MSRLQKIVTLNELDPGWNIPLRTATRASANFPLGFPLMKFGRQEKSSRTWLRMPDGSDDILEITDGGVLDNTGVDSALSLLRGPRSNPLSSSGNPQQTFGGSLKGCGRPVMIFHIDNGELPRDRRRDNLTDWLLHHKNEVDNALWRANLNIQAALNSLYVSELCEILGEPKKPWPGATGYQGKAFAFFRVQAGERESEHVSTSWHLHPARFRKGSSVPLCLTRYETRLNGWSTGSAPAMRA